MEASCCSVYTIFWSRENVLLINNLLPKNCLFMACQAKTYTSSATFIALVICGNGNVAELVWSKGSWENQKTQ